MHKKKIDSKQIKGRCTCFIQIKTYSHTSTILEKYNCNHFHPTSKNNLKYIQIHVEMWELIEAWVCYRVTDQKIVSDLISDHDWSN